MNYYLDTEFLEGAQKKRLLGMPYGDTPETIDLISIGIVSEDNREYYSICNEFNLEEAWNRHDLKKVYPDETESGSYLEKVYWIRDNVLFPIYLEHIIGDAKNIFPFTLKTMRWIIKWYGKSRKEIAAGIKKFCIDDNKYPLSSPIFYGYYADYDWVVFCWIFGKMIDLPEGFPNYCIDLKQTLDEKAKQAPVAYNVSLGLKAIKMSPGYPYQSDEHNALSDARWNKRLHEFINTL